MQMIWALQAQAGSAFSCTACWGSALLFTHLKEDVLQGGALDLSAHPLLV